MAEFVLTDPEGREGGSGEALIRLDEENLRLLPRRGGGSLISLRELTAVRAGDYRIEIALAGGGSLLLKGLGYHYEDFLRHLHQFRNELCLQDLLMEEKLRRAGVGAAFIHRDAEGRETQRGEGQVRLYETGLVLLPKGGELLRWQFSEVRSITPAEYTLRIEAEDGAELLLSRLGYEFESFAGALGAAVDEMALRAQEVIRSLEPLARADEIRRAACLMREGWAARRRDLDAVNPAIWTGLERRLQAAHLSEEYAFLRDLAPESGLMRLGFKRGLMGDLTGDYLWLLVPLANRHGRPAEAVALEAVQDPEGGESGADGESGRATYFFRLYDEDGELADGGPEAQEAAMDRALLRINRSLIRINFRREPLYLPEERLLEPRYRRYLYSLAGLEDLRRLRRLYLGRAMHTTPEGWRRNATVLLTGSPI